MENLGLQADIEISLGAPGFETNDRLIDTAGAPYDSSTKYTRNLYGIKFMVVPRFEVVELLNMYTGVGLGYFWNSLHYEISRSAQAGTTTEKGRIVSSPTLGFTGLIGADYPISDIVSIFGEIAFDQVSFRWKKQIVETTNIKDHKIGTSFFEEDDPSNPAPLKVPGSNWQIRIGARFNIL
jgi:opacity protein-like surface antigen